MGLLEVPASDHGENGPGLVVNHEGGTLEIAGLKSFSRGVGRDPHRKSGRRFPDIRFRVLCQSFYFTQPCAHAFFGCLLNAGIHGRIEFEAFAGVAFKPLFFQDTVHFILDFALKIVKR